MSRIISPYSPVNPQRVNPEFIGIGERFSEHKKNRLDSDKFRKNIESNYAFTLKLNQQLQRSLESKEKQLHRLQAVRQRHHNDINFKISEENRKHRQLQELRAKSKNQRMALKNGIKQVQNTLKSDRLANKIAAQEELHEKNLLKKAESQANSHQKQLKHRSIEIGKKMGNERINQYYRSKNMQSFNNYMRRIYEEDQRSGDNVESIKLMTSHMKKLEKKIQKKQNKLKSVLEEINMYAVESQNQRKAHFLATVSAFRPASTMNSWRSRPNDALRNSVYKNKVQETV